MSYENWLNELEGFSLRSERAFNDINTFVEDKSNHTSQWEITSLWMKTAYMMGKMDCSDYHKDLIESLKNEIKTQRKEIAALREERRMFLDKDFPPGYKL